MFERYYRGTNSRENIRGSGLGMSIAKQIVEAMDGTIGVESGLHQGTTITLQFPIQDLIND